MPSRERHARLLRAPGVSLYRELSRGDALKGVPRDCALRWSRDLPRQDQRGREPKLFDLVATFVPDTCLCHCGLRAAARSCSCSSRHGGHWYAVASAARAGMLPCVDRVRQPRSLRAHLHEVQRVLARGRVQHLPVLRDAWSTAPVPHGGATTVGATTVRAAILCAPE
jgi:hypothetical protein